MSSNWWADKLGAQQQPAAPRSVTPQQPTSYPPTQQQPPYLPPEVRNHQLPISATTASRCPGCGSGNYTGGGENKPRCYDCGYPIQQSGSGIGKGIMGGPQASGPAQPARQVATGGFNPQTIIGHI
jgi:hypothetical protein